MTTLFSDLLSEIAAQAQEDYDLNIDSGIGLRTSIRFMVETYGQLSSHQIARLSEQYQRWYRPKMGAA